MIAVIVISNNFYQIFNMLLITPEEVISHAFTSREVIDSSKIRPSKIDIAQEHFIRPRIGDKLYDLLTLGEFSDFANQYLKAPLAYFIRYSIIEEFAVELSDNGAVIYTGANEKNDRIISSTSQKQEDSQISGTKSDTGSDNGSKKVSNSFDNSKTSSDLEITKEDENGRSTHSGTDSFLGKDKKTTTVTTSPNSTTVVQDDIDKINDIDMSDTKVNTVNKNQKTDIKETQIGSSDDSTTTSNSSTNTTTTSSSQTQNANTQNESDDQLRKTVSSFVIAPPALIHKLQIRALSDANILMTKALRYIQKNPDIFGEIKISSSSFYF